ncbi:phosphonopyruvate decarboxylase [Nocardia sp. CDC160]|uniref:phosphonopyruvate decarboxylase n=1 Tax=Nocardia sp. CDC160 TaxID=3112166 RepID=UPI002DBF3D4F|nr:phosphonopyruvate decarboxylase [Nocardia sp. CDC160]MEC3916073.1 phosphonopyruvate decarboxylase [Nocardia sp. CDC160]
MISAAEFCAELDRRGFTVASGVPCSYFGGPIALLGGRPGRYLPAPNEGAALAIAAGAALAGGRPYLMLQNSGLGNLINPLTSLTMTYRIPVLAFVSLRGWPDPAHDEPQHEVMGTATHALLDTLRIHHGTMRSDADPTEFRALLDAAHTELAAGRPAFILVEKGAVGSVPVPPALGREALNSAEVMRLAARAAGETGLIVASTGYTARELFAVADRPGNFYMQGSMGHALAIGLGLAHTDPGRPIIVIDGDGSALMHLGTFSVVGHHAPANLIHLVLDNGMHESTGGQPSTSGTTDFAAVATAVGYRTAVNCHTAGDLELFLRMAPSSPGPHLAAIPTGRRAGQAPPRATSSAAPHILAARFANTAQRKGLES